MYPSTNAKSIHCHHGECRRRNMPNNSERATNPKQADGTSGPMVFVNDVNNGERINNNPAAIAAVRLQIWRTTE